MASGGLREIPEVVKHAAVVTPDEEDTLWALKVIGDHDPLVLQRAVFFYVGKTFCLRGGEEQHRLKPSQLFVLGALTATPTLKMVPRIRQESALRRATR